MSNFTSCNSNVVLIFCHINYVAAMFCFIASRNMEMHENSFVSAFVVVLTTLLHIPFKWIES